MLLVPSWHFSIDKTVPLWYHLIEVMIMALKQLRKEKGLTQIACAEYLKIPVRTYKRYEANESKIDPIKYQYIQTKLNEYGFIDEEHGILTVEQIKDICQKTFPSYPVDYCYLFGSYAKGKATEKSDVDLLVAMPIDGLKFYELLEILREKMKKNVDLLDIRQINNNSELVQEILKDGIKIYG